MKQIKFLSEKKYIYIYNIKYINCIKCIMIHGCGKIIYNFSIIMNHIIKK